MAIGNFDPSLRFVLKHEGGYVNHPRDPGGPTNRGVTQRVYDAFRRLHKQPTRSVKHLTASEVRDIYYDQYWRPVQGPELPAGVDYCVFDAAVNSGPSRAAKWLQGVVGTPRDGFVGAVTLAATNDARDADTINTFCDERMEFLRDLSTWSTFGKGWSNRVKGVRVEALRMVAPRAPVAEPVGAPPVLEPDDDPTLEAKPPPPKRKPAKKAKA